MSRSDRFDFTLDEETEKRLYELMTDIDTRNTNRFWIKDKRGYHAEYVKVIRCKDCEYFTSRSIYGHGLCDIHCNGIGKSEVTSEENFCSWAERKDEYVTLHHDDIHFIDEDAERAFYESLAERKEE